MFRLRKQSSVVTSDLLTSQLYDERYFYPSFVRDLKAAKREVIIESPYLTVKRVLQFASIFRKLSKRGVCLRVNTRIPQHHTRDLRIQSERAIVLLKKVGVRVYVCSDHRHRKVAIIDGSILWEGSLNILSQSNSREIMRRIESVQLATQMLRFTDLRNKYW